MEAEQTQEYDILSLKTIERYLWMLIESYPEPINQTELARRVGVTRAAVSQAREEIIKICDLKSLAYEKKLVLKKDINTGFSLLAYITWCNTPDDLKKYLSSKYFDDIIEEVNIYEKIKENITSFDLETYLTKEDFHWSYIFIKNKILSHEPNIIGKMIVYEFEDDLSQEIFLKNLPINVQFIYASLYDTSLTFLKKEEDFIKLLEIKDKLYYLIINNDDIKNTILNEAIKWLEIEDEQDDEVVNKASVIIFNQFIKKMFNQFTSYVYEESIKIDMQIKNKYKKLGSLFKI